jgi:hypothetical protein
VWKLTSVIPAIRTWKQENPELKANKQINKILLNGLSNLSNEGNILQ